MQIFVEIIGNINVSLESGHSLLTYYLNCEENKCWNY